MIIIKTPQPDIEELLVLVPVAGPGAPRDATPVDLERAGYVLREQAAPGTLAHLRADLRDAVRERDELRHHYDAAAPEHNLVALLDSYESDADTARAQASAAYAMVVAAIGSVGAETIEAAVARLVADRGALVARAEKAERERDTLRTELARLTAPAEGEPTDEELRDAFEVAYRDAPSECCHANAIRALWRAGVAHERARQQPEEDRATDEELERAFYAAYDPLVTNGRGAIEGRSAGLLAVAARVRQERCLVTRAVGMLADVSLARLTAPAEGEPSFEHLRDCWDMAPRADASGSDVFRNGFFALYRLGVAHERARQQPAQDRATDEELERAYSAAYARAWESEVSTPDRGERAGLLAVAARVRQERCLVARVVSASMSMHVYRRGHDGWAVALGPRFVECERADVPATLARLLGEVER